MKNVSEMTNEELVEEYAVEVDCATRSISTDPPSRECEMKEEILRRLENPK